MSDTGHWIAQGLQLEPDRAIGFVYLIVDLETKQKYIGKKNFAGRGKKNKGDPSNWKAYYSSSKTLQAMIEEKGKDAFAFIIIEQYFTLGGLSFRRLGHRLFVRYPLTTTSSLIVS